MPWDTTGLIGLFGSLTWDLTGNGVCNNVLIDTSSESRTSTNKQLVRISFVGGASIGNFSYYFRFPLLVRLLVADFIF